MAEEVARWAATRLSALDAPSIGAWDALRRARAQHLSALVLGDKLSQKDTDLHSHSAQGHGDGHFTFLGENAIPWFPAVDLRDADLADFRKTLLEVTERNKKGKELAVGVDKLLEEHPSLFPLSPAAGGKVMESALCTFAGKAQEGARFDTESARRKWSDGWALALLTVSYLLQSSRQQDRDGAQQLLNDCGLCSMASKAAKAHSGNGGDVARLDVVFAHAERSLGIPNVADASAFAAGSLDDISTYLTSFFRKVEDNSSSGSSSSNTKSSSSSGSGGSSDGNNANGSSNANGDAGRDQREVAQSKEQLQKAKQELWDVKRKLRLQKQAQEDREREQEKLQRKVRILDMQLEQERRGQVDEARLKAEKIAKLEKKIESSAGGERRKLIEHLKAVKGSTNVLRDKQQALRASVEALRRRLAEEARLTERLEEETRRKEQEKKKLDAAHKLKMTALRRKLMAAMQEGEITTRKIGDEEAEIGKLQVQKEFKAQDIKEKNLQIEDLLSNKEQIAETKKRLQRELERAKVDLEGEKTVTHDMRKDNHKLVIKTKHLKNETSQLYNEHISAEARIHDLEAGKQDIAAEAEMTEAEVRKLRMANLDLKNEASTLAEDVIEEEMRKERMMAELDAKFDKSLSEVERREARDLERIKAARKAAKERATELASEAEIAAKATKKGKASVEKVTRQNKVMAGHVSKTHVESKKIEAKKNQLERELERAAEYLNTERSAKNTQKKELRSKQRAALEGEKTAKAQARHLQDMNAALASLEADLGASASSNFEAQAELAKQRAAVAAAKAAAAEIAEDVDDLGEEREASIKAAQDAARSKLTKERRAHDKAIKKAQAARDKIAATQATAAEELAEVQAGNEMTEAERERRRTAAEWAASELAAEDRRLEAAKREAKEMERELAKRQAAASSAVADERAAAAELRKAEQRQRRAARAAQSEQQEVQSLAASKQDLESQLANLQLQLSGSSASSSPSGSSRASRDEKRQKKAKKEKQRLKERAAKELAEHEAELAAETEQELQQLKAETEQARLVKKSKADQLAALRASLEESQSERYKAERAAVRRSNRS